MLILPGRRGFTLTEVMVTLVIMLVVAGAVHRLLVTTQRLSRSQAQQVGRQSSLRAGSLVVVHELQELSTSSGGRPDQNDILRIAPSGITYRAMRGVGFLCQAPSPTSIRIGRSGFSGHRDPQPGRDSAYVFIGGAPGADPGNSWLPVAITGVVTASTCAGGLGPGISLTIPDNPLVAALEIGTPIRLFELMELRLYPADGKSWLGARSVSAGEIVQPVVGPLADRDGFGLTYLNGWGAPTSDVSDIKSIRVTLRSAAPGGPGSGGSGDEQLVAQVSLRNALGQ